MNINNFINLLYNNYNNIFIIHNFTHDTVTAMTA